MSPVAATPMPTGTPACTVADARRTWAAEFRLAGLDSPELDARLLVGHALGLDHAALAAAAARVIDSAEQSTIAALASRRLGHEPVARILGVKEFWSLDLRIDAATLVPRPETETVVEAALAAIDARGDRARALRIADLGTGSGAILLALLTELPNAYGVGSDISLQALALARANARSLGLNRAAFVACTMAAALRGPFDLIVSNPPYIASDGIAGLPAEVRLFDPRLALDGGPDGLDCYRSIAAAVPALLAPDGAVVVELGAGQAEAVAGLFAGTGLAPSPPRPDLSGVPRALTARKRHQG
jgi:release factor glutamine methyltransferase